MLKNITDNPFVGLEGAEEFHKKHQAVELISLEIRKRGFTECDLIIMSKLQPQDISDILRRKLKCLSAERL